MLLENISQYLLDFTGRIESKGVVSAESATKIRKYIRKEESPVRWELFMILGGILGAIFASAGIYAIISHNWYDYPKALRGLFGIVPSLVGLYFYYRMLFFHKNSRVWVEASSLFLMLMIGASMTIISQTYQMDGEFTDFIKIWLVLTIPLFYIARASGIAFFYLILSLILLYADIQINIFGPGIENGGENYWFWLYFVALLPHFYLSVDWKSRVQGVRVMFLTLIIYITLYQALMYSADSNRLLWAITYNVGFYMFASRFMGGHTWFLSRFMSWIPQISVALTLLALSNQSSLYTLFTFDSIFNMDNWEMGEWYYFILLLVVLGGIYYNYFTSKEHYQDVNKMILFSPLFIIFLMIIDEYTVSWWWLTIPTNLYVLMLGVVVMVNGSEDGRFVKVLGGMVLIALLAIIRYIDVDLSFITKGLLFLIFGGMFFLINMFVKEKVEQIERHKRRADEG